MRDTSGIGAVIFALPQPSPIVTDTHYAPQLHTHEEGRCEMHSLTSGVFITDDLKSTTSSSIGKRYCITSPSLLRRGLPRGVTSMMGHAWTHTVPGCFEFGKVIAHEVQDGHPWYTIVEVFKEVIDSDEEEKEAWERKAKEEKAQVAAMANHNRDLDNVPQDVHTSRAAGDSDRAGLQLPETPRPRAWRSPGLPLRDLASHKTQQAVPTQTPAQGQQQQSQSSTRSTKPITYVCLKSIKPVAVVPNKPEPLLSLVDLISPDPETFTPRESQPYNGKSLGGIYCFSIKSRKEPTSAAAIAAAAAEANVKAGPIGHNLEGCLVVRRDGLSDGSGRITVRDEVLGIAICFDATVKTTALALPLGVVLGVISKLTGEKVTQGAEPAKQPKASVAAVAQQGGSKGVAARTVSPTAPRKSR